MNVKNAEDKPDCKKTKKDFEKSKRYIFKFRIDAQKILQMMVTKTLHEEEKLESFQMRG